MPWQKSGNDDADGEKSPPFPAGPRKEQKDVAAGSALPGHAGHGLVGFQLCGLSVVCGLQGKVNRCGHPVPPSRLP